jgi:hypothetical protein
MNTADLIKGVPPSDPKTGVRLVVDEPLLSLIPFLESQQFCVLALEPGMEDQMARPSMHNELDSLLSEGILVTNRAEAFRHAAAVNGFSIIDIAEYSADPQILTEEIAARWVDLHVRGRVPYILRLNRHGRPLIERVE